MDLDDKVVKREDYLSWDDYFMGIAKLSAERSKDPKTQVGACIVDDKNRIVSIGYNGFPRGCPDDDFPWASEAEDFADTKNAYVVHAEVNTILNAGRSVEGCHLYITLSPCNECMKIIIQAGIKEIIYLEARTPEKATYRASRRMGDAIEMITRQYEPTIDEIVINLNNETK